MQISRAYSGLLRVISKKHSKDLCSLLKYNFSSHSDQPLILGIDQSTTTTKINIYDTKSNNLFSEMKPHKQITPQSGWLEHNPLEILENLDKIAQTATSTIDPSRIKCIGVTNQRETVIAWNKKTGQPYHNAIVWSDGRTFEIAKKFLAKHKNNKECFKPVNGLPVSTYFSAFKIRWLLDNVPAISRDIDDVLFGTIDSWLIWNLTGQHVTDVTNASRTYLMDLQKFSWHPELLDEFNIPLKCLPKILNNSDDFGSVQKGPLKGIPITGCLGDQHAAALGHGLLESGQAKNTYGTGSFLIVNVGEKVVHVPGLISTLCYKMGKNQAPVYGIEGSIETGGNTINWLKDTLGLFSTWKELEEHVEKIPDNGGVYFVPAFSGLYSPQWNETATGTIIGLTSFASKSHIIRACLEAIAYRTKDVVKCIEDNSSIKIQKLNVDGGVTVNEFFMQFQADLLQKPIEKPSIKEATCFGAAVAAGLQAGLFKNLDEIKKFLVYEKKVNYDAQKKELMESNYSNWLEAVKRSINWKSSP